MDANTVKKAKKQVVGCSMPVGSQTMGASPAVLGLGNGTVGVAVLVGCVVAARVGNVETNSYCNGVI